MGFKIIQLLLMVVIMVVTLTGCVDGNHTVVKARKGDFQISIKATGELASADTVFLSPPAVSSMWRFKLNFMLPQGSTVKKGQVVARYETKVITDKLKQKQDQLSTVSKELENKILQQEKDRQDLLVKLAEKEMEFTKARRKTEQIDQTSPRVKTEKLKLDLQITQADLTLYKTKVEHQASEAQLALSIKKNEQQNLQAKVNKLKTELARLTVKAPKDGLFIISSNREGDQYAVGDLLYSSQIFASIPSLDKMVVKAKIAERDLGKISKGMAVEVMLDANPEVKYAGTLLELGSVISEKAKNNPEKVITAQIAISQADRQIMRPGMVARVSLIVQTQKDVIIVPSAAVTTVGGQSMIKVRTLFGYKQTAVALSAFDQNHAVVATGILAGEEILL